MSIDQKTAALRIVLGDQLTRSLSALRGLDPARDIVLMAEVDAEARYVKHHKQKIALCFAAMRHFARELQADGVRVRYVAIDDPANSGTLTGEIARAAQAVAPTRIVLTAPGEYRLAQAFGQMAGESRWPVDILADDGFVCAIDEFNRWAEGRRALTMEFFYRQMRKKTGLLMQGDKPVGGQWNFDAANREPLPKAHRPPARLRFAPDAITRDVIALVEARYPDHFGETAEFGWPVTRDEALRALGHFIDAALPTFGRYQDAMREGAPFLYHSLIAPALNLHLLEPLEVCRAAEMAFHAGHAPLEAVEGFIRQIIGWREYVRGVYWRFMPDYAASNALEAHRPIPDFYWTGKTDMRCMAAVIDETRRHAYSHHIQRLMITGNFALLAGLDPAEVEEWYLAVYADAYDWVELPNTHGMALYADGGVLATKPYAASGAYINRMSNFCSACRYDVSAKLGSSACPFNALYWAFLIRNRDRLGDNLRMKMPYRMLAKWDEAKQQAYVDAAAAFLDGLKPYR